MINATGICSLGDFVYDELTDDNRYIECSVCLEPWREPAEVLPCKHIFCKRCIEMLKSDECPECRERIAKMTRPNRVILAMLAHLYGTCRRCGWHGTLECYESHAKECTGNPPLSSKQFTCGAFSNNSSGRFVVGTVVPTGEAAHVDPASDRIMRLSPQATSPILRYRADNFSGPLAANCVEATQGIANALIGGAVIADSPSTSTGRSFQLSGGNFSSGVDFGEADERNMTSAPVLSTTTTESLFDAAEMYPNCRQALVHDKATVECAREFDRGLWLNSPWVLYGLSDAEYKFALTVTSLLGLPDDRENLSVSLSLVDTRRFLRMMNLPSLLADISQLIRAFYPNANVNGSSWRRALMPRCPRLGLEEGARSPDKEKHSGYLEQTHGYTFYLHQLLLWVGSQHRNSEMLYDLCPTTYYQLLEANLTLENEFSGVVTSVEHFAHLYQIAVDMPSIGSTPSTNDSSRSTFLAETLSRVSQPLEHGYLATSKERYDTLMESTRRLVPYGYPADGILLDGILVLAASDREGFVFCEEASEVPMMRGKLSESASGAGTKERNKNSDESSSKGMKRVVSQPFDFFGKSRRNLHPSSIFQRIFATPVKKRSTADGSRSTHGAPTEPAESLARPHVERVEDDNTCVNFAQTYASGPTDDVFGEARKFALSVARFFNNSSPSKAALSPQDDEDDDRTNEENPGSAAHTAVNTTRRARLSADEMRGVEDKRYEYHVGQEEAEEELPPCSSAHVNSVASN